MKQIDTAALMSLCGEAAAAPRLRKNQNLHAELDDPVQRLLNAFEPGTYLRPHRHAAPPKWELFVVLNTNTNNRDRPRFPITSQYCFQGRHS